MDDGVTVRCSWFVYFFSCKGLVDNKYSRNIERIFEMIFLDLLFTSMLQGKNQVQRSKLAWIPKFLPSFYFIFFREIFF